MKSINLIYKNGHFYDAQSKQRLELADGAEVMLVVTDPEFVKPQKFVGENPNPKTFEDLNNKLKRLKENGEIQKYELLYPRKTQLYFTIPIAIDDKTYTQYKFEVELLEELYAIIKTSWKDQSAGLYDCACRVINNPSQNIDFFEMVCAKSLNELYKNTYVHYFRNKGNPACNAMDRFYLNENPNETIRKKITIK